MGIAKPIASLQSLEPRVLLAGSRGTIWSGVYSFTMPTPTELFPSDLGTINPNIHFGSVDIYDIFNTGNTGATPGSTSTASDSPIYEIWTLDGGPIIWVRGDSGNDRISIFARDGKLKVLLNGKESSTNARSVKINGNGGNDKIVIDLGDDFADVKCTIEGGAGNDTLWAGPGPDRIYAGDGDDIISAGGARDSVYADAGNDFLRGGGSSDLLDGGEGYDTIFGDAGNDNISGGANPDRLRGGDGNDTLRGNGGRISSPAKRAMTIFSAPPAPMSSPAERAPTTSATPTLPTATRPIMMSSKTRIPSRGLFNDPF